MNPPPLWLVGFGRIRLLRPVWRGAWAACLCSLPLLLFCWVDDFRIIFESDRALLRRVSEHEGEHKAGLQNRHPQLCRHSPFYREFGLGTLVGSEKDNVSAHGQSFVNLISARARWWNCSTACPIMNVRADCVCWCCSNLLSGKTDSAHTCCLCHRFCLLLSLFLGCYWAYLLPAKVTYRRQRWVLYRDGACGVWLPVHFVCHASSVSEWC